MKVASAVVLSFAVFTGATYGEFFTPEAAAHNPAHIVKASAPAAITEPNPIEEVVSTENLAEQRLSNLYQTIFTNEASMPSYTVFRKGMVGYLNLLKQGKLTNNNILTLIDFSLPSVQKRLWVVDLENRKLLFHDLVAHGKNTGGNMATNFSNTPNSNQSSLGFYVTAHTYFGKHGLSLRLAGQEEGFNSNAMRRAIVMHGADYVNEGIGRSIGRLGRSFGCPAISKKIYKEVINTVADGSCLFIYHPSADYNNTSALLQEDLTTQEFLLASRL